MISNSVTIDKDILLRTDFQAVPMTIVFNGITQVKAGTPVNASGEPVTSTPWSGAVGILISDVSIVRPQGSVLKFGFLNSEYAQTHSELTYDSALKSALRANGCLVDFDVEEASNAVGSALVGTAQVA